jgi:hypothetical protein
MPKITDRVTRTIFQRDRLSMDYEALDDARGARAG